MNVVFDLSRKIALKRDGVTARHNDTLFLLK